MAGFFDVIREPPVPLGQEFPWFNRLSLETSAYCNRRCSFCPVSSGRRPKQLLMPQETYDRILSELRLREYQGIISLFYLNEATLDKRLPDMCQQAREACPKSTIYISTNADTITRGDDLIAMVDRVTDMFDCGFNVINLNIYDSGEAQHDKLYAIAELGLSYGLWQMTTRKYSKHSVTKRMLAITDMRPERLTASSVDKFFARSTEDRSHVTAPQVMCGRPFRHMVITYDAKVILCCALDPTVDDVITVGDLNTQTMREVWDSETFFKYRWFLQQARRVLPGCSDCDHRMSFSHVVRRVTADEGTRERWEAEARAGLSPVIH